MTWGGRGRQHVAHLNGPVLTVHLAVDLPDQGDRPPFRRRLLPVENQARPVVTSPRNHSCDFSVVALVARAQYPVLVEHHDHARLDALDRLNGKILGKIGSAQNDIDVHRKSASNLDITIKVPGGLSLRPHAVPSSSVTGGNSSVLTRVAPALNAVQIAGETVDARPALPGLIAAIVDARDTRVLV